tara:strand:- start:1956 stop:2252 length:297 start_codon:yes stop_codon:yes gene_type:complete
MKAFLEKLASLEAKAFEDYDNDARYRRIRADILDLLKEAQTALPAPDLLTFKSSVMDVLYRICGTHLDLDVLGQYTPDVLSEDDFRQITWNSALARWM